MTTLSNAFVDAAMPLRFTHAAMLKLWFARGTGKLDVAPPLPLAKNTLFDCHAFETVRKIKSTTDETNGQGLEQDSISVMTKFCPTRSRFTWGLPRTARTEPAVRCYCCNGNHGVRRWPSAGIYRLGPNGYRTHGSGPCRLAGRRAMQALPGCVTVTAGGRPRAGRAEPWHCHWQAARARRVDGRHR